jgi:hypothetical protein
MRERLARHGCGIEPVLSRYDGSRLLDRAVVPLADSPRLSEGVSCAGASHPLEPGHLWDCSKVQLAPGETAEVEFP